MKKSIATAFLVVSLFGLAMSQPAAETYRAAEKAVQTHDFGAAIHLFERASFFAPEGMSVDKRLNLARSYAMVGKYDDGTQVLNEALMRYDADDSTRIECLLKQAYVSFIAGNATQMKYWMLQVDTQCTDSQTLAYHILLGGSHYLLGELHEAESEFLHLSAFSSAERQAELASITAETERYLKKKPNAAMFMSMALPGLGQLYAKEPIEGLNSFLLNSATASIYIVTLVNIGAIEALILVYPWFIRYFKGGYERARDLVQVNQERQKIDDFQRIMVLINM